MSKKLFTWFMDTPFANIRVGQICQKLKIQKVIPLRFQIWSNQMVSKKSKKLKTSSTHTCACEAILLKKIFRH